VKVFFREFPSILLERPASRRPRWRVGLLFALAYRGFARYTAFMHATEFLDRKDAAPPTGVVVLFGEETQLRQDVVRALVQSVLRGDELSLGKYAGKDVELKTILDELRTVSMFSSGRMVVVEEADDFVSNYRTQLEEYVERPAKGSLLVLNVKSWPANTRLAKKLATGKAGLALECKPLSGAKLMAWLTAQAKSAHNLQLTRDGAALMAELAGNSLGLLTQELSKLAAYVGDRSRIGVEDVRALVGGWRAETTWTMLNAVRDNDLNHALLCLDKLMVSGEPALKILGGVTFVFRKLATATDVSRQGTALRVALKDAAVFPSEIDAAEKYLRRIGRARADRIIPRIAETDYRLKGGSRLPERVELEQLLIWLAGAAPVEAAAV
jgi:DNA polymerase-3 subunit delta